MSWRDVEHWLWPLFTERWGGWRYHRLGLPAVPYSVWPPGVPLPPPPPLLYGAQPPNICTPPAPGTFTFCRVRHVLLRHAAGHAAACCQAQYVSLPTTVCLQA